MIGKIGLIIKSRSLILLLTLASGCSNSIPYKGNKDLIGYWEAKSVEIVAPSYDGVRFPMQRYGFASLTINNDSSYIFNMEIMQDVILEKEVFGNPYSKVVLNAGYQNYKQGYYLASDTSIILYDANKIFSNEYNYDFSGQILYTRFIDKEKKRWKISWEK